MEPPTPPLSLFRSDLLRGWLRQPHPVCPHQEAELEGVVRDAAADHADLGGKYWHLRRCLSDVAVSDLDSFTRLREAWDAVRTRRWKCSTSVQMFGWSSASVGHGGAEVSCSAFESVMTRVAEVVACMRQHADYALCGPPDVTDERYAVVRDLQRACELAEVAVHTRRSWVNLRPHMTIDCVEVDVAFLELLLLMCRTILDVTLLRTRSALAPDVLLARWLRVSDSCSEEAERLATTVPRPSVLFGRSLTDKWREDACECFRHLSRAAEFMACEIVEDLAVRRDDRKVALQAVCRAVELVSLDGGASVDGPGMQGLRRRSLVHASLCGVDVSSVDTSSAAFRAVVPTQAGEADDRRLFA